MFDQSGFNQPFDRVLSVNVYGTFEIISENEIDVIANIEAHPKFFINHSSKVIFDAVRDQFSSFILEHIGELEFEGTRYRGGQFNIQSKLEMNFNAGRFHVDFIEFTGEFKPGDRIVIDSNLLKMTLNNQNALHLMQGDFFDLNTGENELTYIDDQSGRTVRMRVTYKDKYV